MEASFICVLGLYYLLIGNGVEFGASTPTATNLHSILEEQPYRTAYHFQPQKNWMNDPNGPMYYKGIYHLFYQYNPYEPLWVPNHMVWAHSMSYDLINWVHLDHALHPTHPFDMNGCWSGSITILPGEKPAILYTGIDIENREVQNLAVPKNLSDPLVIEWVKSANNPIMIPVDGIDPDFYRDPTTAWKGPDNRWRVIVGSQINGHGTAILYTSEDFVNWTRSETPLHSSNKTEMWECPDFYPVSVKGKSRGRGTKHVLKASFNHQDHYVMGNYDPRTDLYVVDTDFMDSDLQLRYDYGKFYASKTFLDTGKNRRVLWAWIQEMDSKSDDIEKGWSGLQSFPRTVSISKSGKQLAQWPIKEIEKLRSEEVNIYDTELKDGSVLEVLGITTSQADVEISFVLPNFEEAEMMEQNLVDPQLLCSQNKASVKGIVGPFGLLVLASKDFAEQTAIFFRIFRSHSKYVVLMCSDQSRSSLRDEVNKTTYGAFVDVESASDTISLRSLIDHSIVESFGGKGITCITARVYPKLAVHKEAHLYAFNNGTQSVKISKLSAWSLKEAQVFPYRKEDSPFSHLSTTEQSSTI